MKEVVKIVHNLKKKINTDHLKMYYYFYFYHFISIWAHTAISSMKWKTHNAIWCWCWSNSVCRFISMACFVFSFFANIYYQYPCMVARVSFSFHWFFQFAAMSPIPNYTRKIISCMYEEGSISARYIKIASQMLAYSDYKILHIILF